MWGSGPVPPTAENNLPTEGELVPTARLRLQGTGNPLSRAVPRWRGRTPANEGADILGVAGSDPVAGVGDRDHRGIDGIASAGPPQKNSRTLAQSTSHRPDVDRTK